MEKICFSAIIIFSTLLSASSASGSDLTKRGAYTMPYLRYDSQQSQYGAGAVQVSAPDFNPASPASEASNQEYVDLVSQGACISWTATQAADGITIRFTLPDAEKGGGTKADLELSINGKVVKSVGITSHWAYQYMLKGVPEKMPTPGRQAIMRFDEVRFLVPGGVKKGDTIKLTNKKGAHAGIDFIELEQVEPAIKKPKDALSVTDFGARPNSGTDALDAFKACIEAAYKQNKSVYIPEGEFQLSDKLELNLSGTSIFGAGMWYTTVFFTSEAAGKGGFVANASDLYLGHMFVNCNNTTRMDNGKNRSYKCISGTWRGQSHIEYLWENHFTVGIWTAGYQGEKPTNGLKVNNVRLRNNYADGVNFAHGSSNCTFEYSDVRNCGDDCLASFSSSSAIMTQPNRNNTFRWNTVEFGWRASGIGMFGGGGHKIYNNYVGEMVGASGLRFVSDFPGSPFEPENPMEVYNCTFYKCGSRQTLYDQIYGALEFHGKGYQVCNMYVHDIDVIDSQVDAIRMVGDKVSGLVFKNINIRGTGKDNRTMTVGDNQSYRGAGIFCDKKFKSDNECSATFINVKFDDCPDGNVLNIGNSYKLTFKQ